MNASMDVGQQKAALRISARSARSALSQADRRQATKAIHDRLSTLEELARARTVIVYSADAQEVDIAELTDDLRARGVATLYPRVRDDHLELIAVDEPSALIVGFRELFEPQGVALEQVDADAILIPGVAFDHTGGRLGRGGGHYDRLLKTLDATRIGVAFACQMVPEVPRETHDVPMHLVVTERSLHRVEGA